ncbi:MAG: membrane protein, partial [Polaribacter sp.]
VFSVYVKEFDTYNQLYGYIGTIIVIMLWIQLNAFILLVGFELNASIAVNRDLKLIDEERALRESES